MELEDLTILPEIGVQFNIEERAGLELAFTKLSATGVNKIYLWGKIFGTEADYFIAYSLKDGDYCELPSKQFYFCTSQNYDLIPFPEMNDWQKQNAAKPGGPLKGTPTETLEEKEEEPPPKEPKAGGDGEEDEEPEEEPEPIIIKFQECHRLVHMIQHIEPEIDVIPKGTYIVSATHDIIENTAYEGMNNIEAGKLHNYFHFRKSTDPKKGDVSQRVGIIDPGDFLDAITEDLPKGVWCRSYNATKTLVMIHNLKWPGFHYFHHTLKPRYGGIYIGTGKPENNLVFMIPN